MNRQQIAEKLKEIYADPLYSTLEIDLKNRIRTWLEENNEPEDNIVKILDDLGSY